MNATTTRTHDAGEQRERLAEELASWVAGGFASDLAARLFYRKVGRLAKAVGRTRDEVYAEIREDAEAILEGTN